MTIDPRDDAAFLAAAERAADICCARVLRMNGQPTVTMTHDEAMELALAFDRAVRLAIAAHLASHRGPA